MKLCGKFSKRKSALHLRVCLMNIWGIKVMTWNRNNFYKPTSISHEQGYSRYTISYLIPLPRNNCIGQNRNLFIEGVFMTSEQESDKQNETIMVIFLADLLNPCL